MLGFAHFSGTKNVGDRVCAPYLYFDFPKADIFDLRSSMPDRDVMIYGGGALRNELGKQHELFPNSLKIAWGVGDTVHGATAPRPIADGFELYGSRDWNHSGAIYVPCPSCMSPLFDQKRRAEHEAVLFVNADPAINHRYPVSIDGLPTMANETDFETVVRFLASGEIVVTNSYHGAYWATLLGRRVILCRPYSSKFFCYRFQPPIVRDDDWKSAKPLASVFDDALSASRAANREFYGLVKTRIKTRAARRPHILRRVFSSFRTTQTGGNHSLRSPQITVGRQIDGNGPSCQLRC